MGRVRRREIYTHVNPNLCIHIHTMCVRDRSTETLSEIVEKRQRDTDVRDRERNRDIKKKEGRKQRVHGKMW